MDIRPARFGFRRAGLVHENSPAWKTEMKGTWEYILENPERRVFMQGTEQMKKRMAEMIWLQYFNEKLFEQKQTPAGNLGRRTKGIAECFGTRLRLSINSVFRQSVFWLRKTRTSEGSHTETFSLWTCSSEFTNIRSVSIVFYKVNPPEQISLVIH